MVVKVYISGISGNKEVKKRQQRVLLILDSRNVKYDVIDIAEPGNEEQKDFMQNNSTSSGGTISDPNPRHPLPPQIFSDDAYCGDYDQFDMANEIDEMEKFLKLAPDDSAPVVTSNAEVKLGNGEVHTENESTEAKELKDEEQESVKDEVKPENDALKDDNAEGDQKEDDNVKNGEEAEGKEEETKVEDDVKENKEESEDE